jgi:hypothetical protein
MTDKVIQELKDRIAAAVKTDQTWRETLGMGTAAASKEIPRAMHLCSLTVQAVCSNPNVGMVASAYFYAPRTNRQGRPKRCSLELTARRKTCAPGARHRCSTSLNLGTAAIIPYHRPRRKT